MKICTTCGSNHADDVDFCPYDGTPLFASASMEDDGLPEPDFHREAAPSSKRLDSSQFPEVEPLVFAQPQPKIAPRLDSAEFPEVEPTLSVNSMPAVALGAEPEPEPPKPSIRQPRAVPIPPPELSSERQGAAQEDDDDASGFDPNAVTPPPMPAVSASKPSEPSVLDLLGDPVPVEDEGLAGLPGDEPLSLDDGLKSRVAPLPEAPVAPPAGSRKLVVGLVVGLIVLAALGAVGYFVVLPMLQQAP